MNRHLSRSLARPFALTALLGLLASACSSGDSGGTGGTGGGTGGRGGTGGSGGATGGSGGGTGGSMGGAGGSGGGSALATYNTCDRSMLQGDFVISLNNSDVPAERFSAIEGRVMDGVEQVRQVKVVKQIGTECRILQPPEAFMCTPQCDVVTQQCTPTGCKPKPRAKDLGAVTVSGLKSGNGQLMQVDGIYGNQGTLPFPAFDEGADLTLQAAGAAGWGPFTLKGWGVAPLVVPTAPVMVRRGQPVMLTWTPPGKAGPSKMFIDFSINRHGAVDAWLECTVPDTGSFTVTAAMLDDLFANGTSGFPSVNFTRQTADRTTVMGGCVQLLVTSPISRELNVEGIVSCNDDKPCPMGKVCREDLSCPP